MAEISLPSSLTNIGSEAFSSCTSLAKISLPSGLINLGAFAFYNCTSLTEISLPSGVTSIGGSTFYNCNKLTKISLPSGLTSIGRYTFFDCSSLKDVYYAGSEEQWNNIQIDAYNENLQNVTMHFNSVSEEEPENLYEYRSLSNETAEITKYNGKDTVTIAEVPEKIDGRQVISIGQEAFRLCRSLTKISLPDGITSIGKNAFWGCSALTEINIPNSATSIGYAAFADCTSLTVITLPNSITHIDDHVFDSCAGLTEITIPNSVSSIGEAAFQHCTALTKIDIPDSAANINSNAFLNCISLEDVHYSGTEEQWNEIKIHAVGNDCLLNAQKYFMEDGYEYKILSDETVEITKCKKTQEEIINIPAVIDNRQVTDIGEAAFFPLTNLKEITIPGGVKRIKEKAFLWCTGLEKITIPDSVISIESQAFFLCGLKEIVLPDSVISIGSAAFARCMSLKEIVLPANITAIEEGMFSFCHRLESINIPAGVTHIGKNAFFLNSCLKDVYYSGTEEQWAKIEVLTEGNEALSKATIHFKQIDPEPPLEEEILPITVNAKQELERLKSGDPFSMKQDFQNYLSDEQINIMESYLYTWLAEINYTYQYNGISGVRERIMKKAGINPQGDFASGMEQAVTHICVETTYGLKTFEITLDLGIPDDNGNLYPTYSAMYYEILEKESIPSDLPTSGQIGRESYADLGTFAECVRKASEDSLHGTYQWESLDEEMTAGVLVDKTVTEIIGNKNGSFSDAVFTIYAKPLFTYSKKVTIACPVDVHVYSMDGKEAGSIVGNKQEGGNANVRLDANGDTKTVYLSGNDYYLNLRGTDTGTMRYEVEEIANEEVRRNVQFLELQLEKDMQYEGYVFRPLNIDRDLYALRTAGGSEQKVFHADQDTYQALFRRIQSLSLSQGQTSLDRDKTVQLQASLFPLDASNPNLRWITDNESIIKVDNNGLVMAVGAGRATVTVATKDGSFLKQYCVIDVAEGNHGSGDSDSSSGSSGGSSSGSSSGSSGWYGGSTPAPVEQEKTPVVVNLHYVLQFHANGGTGLSRRTMTLLADDCPGIMPKVKRKDYIFDGWYTQQDGGEQVTGDKPLKEAATLYAQWTKAEAPAKAAAPILQSKKKGQMQVSLNNVTGAAGYQIEYSSSKKFTSAKVKDVGAAAKKTTIFGLKAGKKYYIRLRAYSLDSMRNRIYGEYSAAKSVSVKR